MKKLLKGSSVLILVAVILFITLPRIIRIVEKRLYPLPGEYISVIEKYSEEYGIPIELLCGVINTESSFDPNATSHAGAMGMMQITEDTFNWLLFKSGESHTKDALYNYETNIRFGAYFLSLLYEEFGDWDTTLAAYNAGRGRVNSWLSDGKHSKDGKLTDIPISETSEYIVKVNKASKKYDKLYFSKTTTE